MDPAIHGILVQLPLMDAHKVIEAIAAEKDVDGFRQQRRPAHDRPAAVPPLRPTA